MDRKWAVNNDPKWHMNITWYMESVSGVVAVVPVILVDHDTGLDDCPRRGGEILSSYPSTNEHFGCIMCIILIYLHLVIDIFYGIYHWFFLMNLPASIQQLTFIVGPRFNLLGPGIWAMRSEIRVTWQALKLRFPSLTWSRRKIAQVTDIHGISSVIRGSLPT